MFDNLVQEWDVAQMVECLICMRESRGLIPHVCIYINDNNLILHIYIIIRKYYHTYFELIQAFYS